MRKHKRFALYLPAAVKDVEEKMGNITFLLRTVDISAGGALFRAERGLPDGAEVSIELFLPSDPDKTGSHLRLAFHGTVIRTQPGCFAVAFAGERHTTGQQEISTSEQAVPETSSSALKKPDKESI